MPRDRRWLLLAALPAFVALFLVVSHYGGIAPMSFAVVLPVLVLALVVPFHLGAERARRRRLRLRADRLRAALRDGNEEEAERQLCRIVSLEGPEDPAVREWLRDLSAPFRRLLMPHVGRRALRNWAGRRDDPLAPEAWLAWLRLGGGRLPGERLREEVDPEELLLLWQRESRAPDFPDRLPPELLVTSRPPA